MLQASIAAKARASSLVSVNKDDQALLGAKTDKKTLGAFLVGVAAAWYFMPEDGKINGYKKPDV